MYRTIQVASCVSVQGEFVEVLADGRVAIRDGDKVYRGLPITPRVGPRVMRASLIAAAKLAERPR